MEQAIYQSYTSIFKHELMPALGCPAPSWATHMGHVGMAETVLTILRMMTGENKAAPASETTLKGD